MDAASRFAVSRSTPDDARYTNDPKHSPLTPHRWPTNLRLVFLRRRILVHRSLIPLANVRREDIQARRGPVTAVDVALLEPQRVPEPASGDREHQDPEPPDDSPFFRVHKPIV